MSDFPQWHRIGRGRVKLWRRLDGVWVLEHHPYDGEPTTYRADDPDLPRDWPRGEDDDPGALVIWARKRWGAK
jgi:hypothetical protein